MICENQRDLLEILIFSRGFRRYTQIFYSVVEPDKLIGIPCIIKEFQEIRF